jgi:hypothetical protein
MHETVLLSDPKSPLRIEYSRPAMEEIRERAREGLMAAPRVGMGIGGLLLGVRQDARTRIVDSIEIPCCHSGGPSFKLTPGEMRQTREMMAEAGEITATSRIAVVGWYCSKTRGDAVLNEFDRQFHDELFPGPWKIALVLRPSAAEPMRAVFYFREETGMVVRGIECEVDEWAPPEPEAAHAATSPVIKLVETPARAAKVIEMSPLETPSPVAMPAPVVAPRTAETTLADIIGVATADGETPVRPRAAAANAELFGVTGMLPVKPVRKWNKPLIGGAIAAALLAAAGGAYATRNSWLPKPPLNLTSTELDGSLLIRWNPDTVKGVAHGTMYISDGSGKQPDPVPLDRFQLSSGLLTYALKTKQVTATLDAGSVHDRTAWFAPPPATPEAPAPAEPSAEKTPIRTVPAQDTPQR